MNGKETNGQKNGLRRRGSAARVRAARRRRAPGEARTRREQIEEDFIRRLKRRLKAAGLELDQAQLELVRDLARSAAIAGACGERDRTLRLLRSRSHPITAALERELIALGIEEVLGYVVE